MKENTREYQKVLNKINNIYLGLNNNNLKLENPESDNGQIIQILKEFHLKILQDLNNAVDSVFYVNKMIITNE